MQQNALSTQRTRDQLFGTGLLTLLRSKGSALPEDIRETLFSMASMPWKFNDLEASRAVKSVFSLHPSFMKDVTPDNMVMHAMLPIFIWAAEEKEKPDCGLAKTVNNWGSSIARDSDCALENSLRSLNIINALRDELTAPDLIALANQWQNKKDSILWKDVDDLTGSSIITWLAAVTQLGLLHEYLVEQGIKDTSNPSMPTWGFRWVQRLRLTLSELKLNQQEECVLHWSQSDLSNVYKLRACKQVSPKVWLRKTCLDALEPLLPKNEVERWPILPWFKKYEPIQKTELDLLATWNQALHQMYCPESASILNVLTTSEQWTDRSYIRQCMSGFATKAPRLEVLTDLDNLFDS